MTDETTTQAPLLPAERPASLTASLPLAQIGRTSEQEPNAALRRSVAAVGVLQAILIRHNPDPDGLARYVVVDGNRRHRAAELADLGVIPTICIDGDQSWSAVAQLTTNATRSQNLAADLRSVEQLANAGYTAKEIGQAVGLTSAQVDRLLGMQRLDPVLRDGLDSGKLALGVAVAAAKLPGASQEALATKFAEAGKLTGDDVAEQKTARAAQALAMTDIDNFLAAAPTLPEHEERARLVSLTRQAINEIESGHPEVARSVLIDLLAALDS
jgi:ParB family chromosome partitioning protein